MKNKDETKKQLARELQELRLRVAELEKSETRGQRADEKIKAAQKYAQNLIDSSPDMVISVDKERRIVEFNLAAQKEFGYTKEEVLGKHVDLLYADPAEGLEIHETVRRTGQFTSEIANRRKNGEIFTTFLAASVMRDATAEILGVMGISRNITQQKQAEETIRKLAYHDFLTGLPNRVLFQDRLTMALAYAQRHQEKLAVMMLDLDQFKNINDTLGHSIGDRLLQDVGKRLADLLRQSDTVARWGGDEFILLLPEIHGEEDIAKVARKILKALQKPFAHSSRQLHITTSIGIAIYPYNGKDADTLIKNADIAMYRAKDQGGNSYQRYTPTIKAKDLE